MQALQQHPYEVVGLDNINDYYDPDLKYARLAKQGFKRLEIESGNLVESQLNKNFSFIRLDLSDKTVLEQLFGARRFDVVVNLAAQAGVAYSLENPMAYVESNLVGFANLLEVCRKYPVKHFLFASSSSVYGENAEIPFSVDHVTDRPVSFYAATKKANEVMAYSYAHLYKIPTTGMRFFTVYGPWGRPDMSYFSFAKSIIEGQPIQLYNQGNMWRDFTYVGDVTAAIVKLLKAAPKSKAGHKASAPYRLYNIGNNQPVQIMELVAALERRLQMKANLELMPMRPGDVPVTYANVDALVAAIGYRPRTTLKQGIDLFMNWFEGYYAEHKVGTQKV